MWSVVLFREDLLKMIREIVDDSELQESAEVIRNSFITVATDLYLNVKRKMILYTHIWQIYVIFP